MKWNKVGWGLALAAALACLLAGAGGLTLYGWRAHTEASAFQKLAAQVAGAAQGPEEAPPEYAALAEENPDLAGWVRVPGTGIDYPVMQTPADPQFYLRRAFDKTWALSGTPFADAACRLDAPGENVLVYGHNMQNGAMFAPLAEYADAAFCAGHPTVEFDTLARRGAYRVCAVLYTTADAPVYRLLAGADEETFYAWRDFVAQNRLYDAGPLPVYGQDILTLSTCDNVTAQGRIVVITAREEADAD